MTGAGKANLQPEWQNLRDSAQEATAATRRKRFDCWRTQRRNWWNDIDFATEFGRMGFEGSAVGLALRCSGVLHQVLRGKINRHMTLITVLWYRIGGLTNTFYVEL
ncbi:uncharacterized protein ACIBXB_007278 isoform 1-T1 [Morphnus guianensis]